jgi:branched-chain amino acid transport system substrate-binding protein
MKPINLTPSSWHRGARLLRNRRTLAGTAVVVLAVTTGCSSAASSSSSSAAGTSASAAASGSSSSASGPAVAGWAQALAAYAAYTGSKPGAADMSLPPIDIGFSMNGGGSIPPQDSGEDQTAVQTFVNYINKYLGGVDGHPVGVVVCNVKNSEEEGAACMNQFLNTPAVKTIDYGSLAVGSATEDAVDAGKKPIIMPFTFGGADNTSPHTYVLGATGELSGNAIGTFAVDGPLHAKSVVIVYPQVAGSEAVAQGEALGATKAGATVKLVGFDETTENVLGALAAADAQSAQAVITASLTTAANCIAFYKAAQNLGISQSKMIGQTDCTSYDTSVTAQYPGGHYPEIWYQRGQPLDDLLLPYTPAGLNFKAVVTGMGGTLLDFENYAWVNEFAGIMTDDKFFNEIGYTALAGSDSAALLEAKAAAFRGPVVMGPPTVECGKYRLLPADCADGSFFFRFDGGTQYSAYTGTGGPGQVAGYIEPSPGLEQYYGVLPGK